VIPADRPARALTRPSAFIGNPSASGRRSIGSGPRRRGGLCAHIGGATFAMETVMNRILITALVASLSFAAAQAGTVTVRHGDLDLASPAGLAALKVRVQTAAAAACGPTQADFGVSARTLY
jgi:UrcA family protein